MTTLSWLQKLYLYFCDENWEHEYGINISTLDNPGWMMEINITDTELENIELENINLQRSDQDWIYINTMDNLITIQCGPMNLEESLSLIKEQILKKLSNSQTSSVSLPSESKPNIKAVKELIANQYSIRDRGIKDIVYAEGNFDDFFNTIDPSIKIGLILLQLIDNSIIIIIINNKGEPTHNTFHLKHMDSFGKVFNKDFIDVELTSTQILININKGKFILKNTFKEFNTVHKYFTEFQNN